MGPLSLGFAPPSLLELLVPASPLETAPASGTSRLHCGALEPASALSTTHPAWVGICSSDSQQS